MVVSVSGETTDISPFCKFGFWDWVKFREKVILFLATHSNLTSTQVPALTWFRL